MTNPPLDLLKYRAFPEVSEAIRARIGQILHRFQHVVRQVLPAAEELTLIQLLNSLPVVLQQIAEALESDEPAATFELLDISQPHGELRFHQHYNVNELLIEYHLIRRIVIEETSDAMNRPLTAMESVALNLGVDTALRRGVVAFVDSQTRQLREINDLQTRYLSFLSHDLRGGLNGTLLMVEVLKRELSGGEAQTLEDLEIMRRSILETVGTLDRFLNAERLRKGAIKISPSRIDISALLRDAIGNLNFMIEEKGLMLETDLPDHCFFVSDREVLSMVLQSLLHNAVKFTRKGTVRIALQCGAVSIPARRELTSAAASPADSDGNSSRFSDEVPHASLLNDSLQATMQSEDRSNPSGAVAASSCVISIEDQGPGIPPEKLPVLFSPSRDSGRKNPGLGLLIAKQAADLLGAHISVTSEVGKGSTFRLSLPELPVTSK